MQFSCQGNFRLFSKISPINFAGQFPIDGPFSDSYSVNFAGTLPKKHSHNHRNSESKKGSKMIRNRFNPFTRLIFLIIIVLCGSQLSADQSEQTPMIHLDQIAHTFPTAFEGEQLSYSFTLTNNGTADLEILDVTHT